MEDFKNRYSSSNPAKRRQDDDHYDKRDVPSLPKRAKTEEAPAGPLATPPDPYAAMALYYSKLHSSFRPWSPKAGFPGPGLPGYSLPHPFSRGGGGGGPLPSSALPRSCPATAARSCTARTSAARDRTQRRSSATKMMVDILLWLRRSPRWPRR